MVILALQVWGVGGGDWSHAVLIFFCDNQSVVDVLKNFTSKDPGMLKALHWVMEFSLHRDLVIMAIHYPGKLNVVADA